MAPKEARCTWSTLDDTIMVRILKAEKEAGNQSGAGWKKQVWTVVEAALRLESPVTGTPKTATKCADHWSNVSRVNLWFMESN